MSVGRQRVRPCQVDVSGEARCSGVGQRLRLAIPHHGEPEVDAHGAAPEQHHHADGGQDEGGAALVPRPWDAEAADPRECHWLRARVRDLEDVGRRDRRRGDDAHSREEREQGAGVVLVTHGDREAFIARIRRAGSFRCNAREWGGRLSAASLVHPSQIVAGLVLCSALGRRRGDDAGAGAVCCCLSDGRLRRENQAVGDDAVQQGNEKDDDEGKLDHLGASLVVRASPHKLQNVPPRALNADPLTIEFGRRRRRVVFTSLRRFAGTDPSRLWADPARRYIGHMDHLPRSPGAQGREWSKGPMYLEKVASYPQRVNGGQGIRVPALPIALRGMLGEEANAHPGDDRVFLFIAGSAIAFASVEGVSKRAGTSKIQAPSVTSVVVAKSSIPAGTTGESMVSNNLVAIEPIPSKRHTAGSRIAFGSGQPGAHPGRGQG